MKMIENLEGRRLYSVSTISTAEPVDVAPPPTVNVATPAPSLLCTMVSNLANMRHEMLKAVAQNLRS